MIILKRVFGANHPNAKINEKQVRQIRREHKAGKRGVKEAHRFKISPQSYNRIGRGLTWGSVPLEDE